MKTWIFLLSFAILSVAQVSAEERTTKSDRPLVGNSTHTEAIREHTHGYVDNDNQREERRNPVVFGGKTDLIKSDKYDITYEISQDTANGELTNKVLFETNLEDGLFQIAWKKFKGLIGRD